MEARRELTLRALVTGMLIGAVLTPCNVYSGLKIGWTFNMSIVALLLAYAFWTPMARWARRPAWELHESNINQTAASSAASIISGGLVAPIPAYLLITGETLAWVPMTAWVFSVSFLGVWVAWFLREPLLGSGLSFPIGVATAETLRDIFEAGREASLRLGALLGTLVFAAGAKLVDGFFWTLPRWAPGARFERLTFALDPSLLMLGFGAIIGFRSGVSLLLGAVVAWGGLAPWAIARGYVPAAALEQASWFQPLVEWLIWPGVSLMVTATLTSLLLRLRGVGAGGLRMARPRGWPARAFVVAAVGVVALEILLFDVHWLLAVLAIPLSFALAAVAARVVGETGIAPIGAIGKVSQLGIGVLAPGQAITNLMCANVAGGAAGQCADLMNDFKAGREVGATPRHQAVAQGFGIGVGSLVGCAVFLWMIPSPETQLLTADWPAPAVAVWKSVAETLAAGLDSIPRSTWTAMAVAAACGVVLGAGERFGGRIAPWLPSGGTLGLAFVIPASTSITIFVGSAAALVLTRGAPRWSARFLVAGAAGLIAGESLFGVFLAIASLG